MSEALLIQALTQSDDAAGAVRSLELLDEASQMLGELTDEAKQIWRAKLMARDIAAARAKVPAKIE